MQQLDELGARFWAWRATQQPRARDDIPRLDRPAGWLPEVDAALVAPRRAEADAFASELAGLHPVEVADRVDHRLLRSALARVIWEQDHLRMREIPRFWIDQSIGPVFDTLLRPGVDEARVREVLRLLSAVPETLSHAWPALSGRAAREFAVLAIDELDGIDARLDACAAALGTIGLDAELHAAARDAGAALLDLRAALVDALPALAPARPVGPDRYAWFLREVAASPSAAPRSTRSGAASTSAPSGSSCSRPGATAHVPVPPLPADSAAQVADEASAEAQVREFYAAQGLLTQPASLRHYLNRPMPAYLEPLRFLGVSDDLTGPSRLDEDGVSYVPEVVAQLPYFYAANARDPRAGIVHEGAHYQQLALSWAHPRPIRRHYYDSGANEGIAFYNEELMLAAGLFADAPHTATPILQLHAVAGAAGDGRCRPGHRRAVDHGRRRLPWRRGCRWIRETAVEEAAVLRRDARAGASPTRSERPRSSR